MCFIWAGHADVETTLNIYTHLYKDRKFEKTELMKYVERLALSLNLSLK